MEEELPEEPEEDHPGRDAVIIFAVFFEGGLAPLSLFLGWLVGHPALGRFAWSSTDALWGAVATIPLVAMFLLIIQWPIGPIGKIKKFWDEEATPLFAESTWPEIALIAISAGVGEEMLFRGVLQSSFTGWFNPAWGLIITSLLFGVLHPISIPYVVMASVVGFYLGELWVLSGNLLTVMVIHALYDFFVLAYLTRFRPTDEDDSSAN